MPETSAQHPKNMKSVRKKLVTAPEKFFFPPHRTRTKIEEMILCARVGSGSFYGEKKVSKIILKNTKTPTSIVHTHR